MEIRQTTSKRTTWKYPKSAVSTVVLGDSQTKNLFQYFDPLLQSTPAFVTLLGALISDVPSLVDFVPSSATTLILHIGSNELARRSALATFQRYRKLLDFIHAELPEISEHANGNLRSNIPLAESTTTASASKQPQGRTYVRRSKDRHSSTSTKNCVPVNSVVSTPQVPGNTAHSPKGSRYLLRNKYSDAQRQSSLLVLDRRVYPSVSGGLCDDGADDAVNEYYFARSGKDGEYYGVNLVANVYGNLISHAAATSPVRDTSPYKDLYTLAYTGDGVFVVTVYLAPNLARDAVAEQVAAAMESVCVRSKVSDPVVLVAKQACPQCKYLRKLLQNQASYRRTANTRGRTPSYKLKFRTAQLKRSRLTIIKGKSLIQNLKENNARIDSEMFDKAVQALPVKQQQLVRASLAACNRRSTKGTKYEAQWVLECAVMCMKSPRLYEHIRKHKIMVLPSRTSLRCFLKKYRSGIGLSTKLLAAVKEKTKTMDP
ncbi:hypothetical protein HPB50_012882 [Hyalomma asiaticum]|uniref:Uncharacterized protein n=1 Tax=Hyalomma asiaticum TaxID=266040 RepID=A0ACB7SW02_HYAAI|nr:hypothetical protein HPB50_012882 [Hyalomma asiaticum]